MNIIARLEFELAYYNSAVHRFNHYTTRTPRPTGKWTKGYIVSFLKKSSLRLTKNYKGTSLTAIVAKIYYALLPNLIQPEVKKILRKNQNGFWRYWSTITQILTIHQIIDRVHVKNLKVTLIYRFLQGIRLHTQRKDRANLLSYGLSKKLLLL